MAGASRLAPAAMLNAALRLLLPRKAPEINGSWQKKWVDARLLGLAALVLSTHGFAALCTEQASLFLKKFRF